MHPSKGGWDYMTEINKLFPRNDINDLFQSPSHASTSPLNQLTPLKSSSSTESSPTEIFPDYTSNLIAQSDFDTPYVIRSQRPIVGRRLMIDTQTDQTLKQKEEYDLTNIWQYDDSRSRNYQSEPRMQSGLFELFPSENKGYELFTPVKKNTAWNLSPTQLPPSPQSNASNCANVGPFPPYPTSPHSINSTAYRPSTSKYPDRARVCTFCRKNGETPMVYTAHSLRQMVGDKSIVTCPILRSHVCSTCGASGDDAHTITYCPVLRNTNNGLPLQSTTITLKNTRIKSNGKRRY